VDSNTTIKTTIKRFIMTDPIDDPIYTATCHGRQVIESNPPRGLVSMTGNHETYLQQTLASRFIKYICRNISRQRPDAAAREPAPSHHREEMRRALQGMVLTDIPTVLRGWIECLQDDNTVTLPKEAYEAAFAREIEGLVDGYVRGQEKRVLTLLHQAGFFVYDVNTAAVLENNAAEDFAEGAALDLMAAQDAEEDDDYL
jgi:hypothetical protein